MADFFTVFMAVFLAEIASMLVERYIKKRAEKILDRIDRSVQSLKEAVKDNGGTIK